MRLHADRAINKRWKKLKGGENRSNLRRLYKKLALGTTEQGGVAVGGAVCYYGVYNVLVFSAELILEKDWHDVVYTAR